MKAMVEPCNDLGHREHRSKGVEPRKELSGFFETIVRPLVLWRIPFGDISKQIPAMFV